MGDGDGKRISTLEELNAYIASLLRPDVWYVTVIQNDGGFLDDGGKIVQNDGGFLDDGVGVGRSSSSSTSAISLLPKMKNVLVLSSGGFGHIPIPLIAGEIPPLTL